MEQQTRIPHDARPEQLDEVARVILDSYAEYGAAREEPPENHAAWLAYREDLADVRTRHTAGARAIVVDDEADRIIGTVTYFPPGTNEEWPSDVATIRLLGVLPAHRGRGLGRLLTLECLRRAHADGARTVGLHTTEMMAVAKGMYERMGFRRFPELDFEPAPDLIVMAYRLEL